MSCEVKTYAKLDLTKVQATFGLSSEEKWLSSVCFSMSPLGDTLALSHGGKLIFLESKFNYEKQENAFDIAWSLELEDPNELITAVLCIPLLGQQSTVDWTCLVVGTQSGAVHFYTDSRYLLLSQSWHTEAVTNVKAQSGKHTYEELYVFTANAVCIVEGHNLFPTLRALRQQYIKSAPISQVEFIPCRKWAFGHNAGQQVNDAVVVGPQYLSTFDHLLTASLQGGFYARYKAAPPQISLFIATGTKPYIGFHYAREGYSALALGDVARVATSLIKSALPAWLRSKPTETGPPTIPAESMVCRFGLCDLMRMGGNIWLAPRNRLAVIADNLGRVVLIDCDKAVAVRIWKGYRDAQCCFMEIPEKIHRNMDVTYRKRALFLVIYAPRRNVLEVWPLQHGPRVAQFSVPRNGILAQSNHQFMGVPDNVRYKTPPTLCLFIDPVDHQIKELTIPFHCANINDGNSKTAKDLHLYKRLKMCIRGMTAEQTGQVAEEARQTCNELKTVEMKNHLIDMLISNRKLAPEILQAALETILKNINDEETEEERHLKIKCCNYMKLVNFYLLMTGMKDCEFEGAEENLIIEENLNISNHELETVQELIDLATLNSDDTNVPKVTFTTRAQDDFHEYLSAFYVSNLEQIVLKTNKISTFGPVGATIFNHYLDGCNPSKLSVFMRKSGIECEDILRLFLYCWAQKPFNYVTSDVLINDMERFHAILRQICTYADEHVSYDYDSLCPLWQNVREFLLDSSSALRGLLAAFVCRNIAIKYEGAFDVSCEEAEEAFERVTQESCQWNLLIGKLDDIAILGAILTNQVKSKDAFLPALPYATPDVSLKQIVNGGKGIVTELVAKWIMATGMNPKKLLQLEEKMKVVEESKEKEEKPEETEEEPKEEKEMFCLRMLYEHFPFSLQSKALLCQLTWDYMSHWSKNLPDLHFMRAGIECLRVFKPEDWSIKHGVCIMVWNAHLKITLKAAKTIIDESGRVPNEKVCLQEIGIPDSSLAQFMEYAFDFMHEFITSISHPEKIEIRFEENLIDDQTRLPLIMLALEQGIANPILLNLHSELLRVLHIFSFFNNKYARPIERLFNPMQNHSFFADIKKPLGYEIQPADLLLTQERTSFLCKIIAETVSLIREDQEGVYLDDHLHWVSLTQQLSETWQLNATDIKHQQIIQLYAYGWDFYAIALLEEEKDIPDIGTDLLRITGQRLSLIMKQDRKALAYVASSGVSLLKYIEKLEGHDLRMQTDNTIDKLMDLSQKSFHYLAEKKGRDLRLAGQMLNAVATIKDYYESK